ncbi:glycosyltransferase [Chryseobacterium sp. Leaf394]|uniref:glycosyltransferase n=1 Tax=Chryseobacterium sp. Leaf394 TaxID=1736361 RepID=UPI0006FD4BDC|nr:glycosyltransferase [Chryseobacterium sp. Leaf394]KQS93196.1 glycosyl transferase family 2 [Chryseobacterium sp. Leaf394]
MITSSVVTYKTSEKDLRLLLNSFTFLKEKSSLIIVDNSPSNSLKSFFKEFAFVTYIHNPSNPGFGASHNLAFKEAQVMGSEFHFVINPDVHFAEDVFFPMVTYMQQHPEIGMMMPQILNDDGTIQNLPKLVPSPYSVLMRKIKKPTKIFNNFINQYELRFVEEEMIYNAPILSGCFTLFRMEALEKVGTYDDRFFMYFEDWDLSRRMHQKFDTVYFPSVSVTHGYESGANKSKHLFKIFVKSAILYFNKWGWVFDNERDRINKKTLQQFK